MVRMPAPDSSLASHQICRQGLGHDATVATRMCREQLEATGKVPDGRKDQKVLRRGQSRGLTRSVDFLKETALRARRLVIAILESKNRLPDEN